VKQHAYVNGKDIIPFREFWTKHFEGAKIPLEIPGDMYNDNIDENGDYIEFIINKKLVSDLRNTAYKRGVTVFNILFAAFGLLLYNKTKEKDLIIGTTAAGRPTAEAENIVGVFVNPLPLRINIDKNMTLDSYINHIKKVLIDFHEYQHYPVEDLIKYVPSFIGLGLNDTFQAYILYQNYWRPEESNITFKKLNVGAETHHKLMREYELVLEDKGDELIGEFWFKTSKYKAETIKKDSDMFINLIQDIINENLPSLAAEF